MFPEGSQVCIGSIRKMDFGQIWHGPTNGSWDELCVPGVECTTSTFLVWSAHLPLSWGREHTFCFPEHSVWRHAWVAGTRLVVFSSLYFPTRVQIKRLFDINSVIQVHYLGREAWGNLYHLKYRSVDESLLPSSNCGRHPRFSACSTACNVFGNSARGKALKMLPTELGWGRRC